MADVPAGFTGVWKVSDNEVGLYVNGIAQILHTETTTNGVAVDQIAAAAAVVAVGDIGGAALPQPFNPGPVIVETERFLLIVSHMKLQTTQRVTMQGTARLRIL